MLFLYPLPHIPPDIRGADMKNTTVIRSVKAEIYATGFLILTFNAVPSFMK
jgi:hypothetical protein